MKMEQKYLNKQKNKDIITHFDLPLIMTASGFDFARYKIIINIFNIKA